MFEKNYVSREEHRVWEYIKDKEIVDNELIKEVFPEMPNNKRNKVLHSLYKKGYLKRARKDIYYNPYNITDFHKLALKMIEGYIGLSSALRYYALLDYEDFTIFVMTKTVQKKMKLKGTQYSLKAVPLKNLFIGFGKKDGIYISSIEKTLFDCFLKPGLIGFSNITQAIYGAKIDWKEFIGFFRLSNNNSLRQRTGYILEITKKKTKIKIPSFVFEFLLKSVKNPVKLMPIQGKSSFNKKWKVQDNLGEEKILSWWR